MTHYSNHKKSSNWLTMESGTLLECGILFPEIKSDWFMTGYRRVMQEVKYSFDNDGIHMERTPSTTWWLRASTSSVTVCAS